MPGRDDCPATCATSAAASPSATVSRFRRRCTSTSRGRAAMSAQHDVVIIGGGAIGLWAAYYLKTRSGGCRVAVVERDFAWTLASTPRASGGVRRLFACPENIELSNASIPVYQAFADLMEVDGEKPDIGFKQNGYLFIVPPAATANLKRNFERQRQHGVNVDWLEPADLKQRFPSMRVDDRADHASAALRALFRVPGSRGAAALPQGRRSPSLPAGGQGLFGRGADAQRAARLQLRGRSRLLRRGRVAGAGASLPAVREDEMQGHPARASMTRTTSTAIRSSAPGMMEATTAA